MTTFNPHVEYDKEGDAVYVYLTDAAVAKTTKVDDYRSIDLDANGAVVGIEFLGVSGGLELSDLPSRHEVDQLLRPLHLHVFA